MILKRKIAIFSLIFGIWMLFGESVAKNFLFENEFEQIGEEERLEVEEVNNKESEFSLLDGAGDGSPSLHGDVPLTISSLLLFGNFSTDELSKGSFINEGKCPIYLLNCSFLI